MQRIEVLSVADTEIHSLAHKDNWGGHVLGNSGTDLMPYEVEDFSGMDLNLSGMISRRITQKRLIGLDIANAEVVGTFDSGTYDTESRRDILYVALDRELLVINPGSTLQTQTDLEPATVPEPELGTAVLRLGSDILHIRSLTVAKVLPGLGILALGLRDKPKKFGRVGGVVFGLDLLPTSITLREVAGAEDMLAKVNAVHLLAHKK